MDSENRLAAVPAPPADAVPWTLAGRLKEAEGELTRARATVRAARRERDAAVRERDEAVAERDAMRAHYERHVEALEERVRALGEKVRAQLADSPGEDGVRRVAELVAAEVAGTLTASLLSSASAPG